MKLVLPMVFALFVVGCDRSRIYEYSQDFKDRSWKSSDTARFGFEIHDPGKKYNVYYNVRNSLDYPYSRLFVQYSLRDSAGIELQKKLVSEFLFDQKSGKPNGTSGLGDVYDHRFPILTRYEFARPGRYQVALEQFMRLDTLPGILAIGLRVEVVEGEDK